MPLPEPEWLALNEAAELVAHRCGVSIDAAKARLVRAGLEHELVFVTVRGERVDNWDNAVIDWAKSSISRRSTFSNVTFEWNDVRVARDELLLADRIVATAWRLRRVVAVETAHFNEERYAIAGYQGKSLSMLSRYEAVLERSLYRSLHELKTLQTEREGRAMRPPPPIEGEVVERDGAMALPALETAQSADRPKC